MMTRADVGADFMQNGGHLQQQAVMLRQAMKILQIDEQAVTQPGDMHPVVFVRHIAVRQNSGKMQDFPLQIPGILFRTDQTQDKFLVVG